MTEVRPTGEFGSDAGDGSFRGGEYRPNAPTYAQSINTAGAGEWEEAVPRMPTVVSAKEPPSVVRQRLQAYPGPSVTEVPHLAATLPIMAAAHNDKRAEAGLAPKSFVPWSYKLLDADSFDGDPYVQATQKQYGSQNGIVTSRVGGFDDREVGLTVVRFDANQYGGSRAGTVSQILDFGHETAHKATDGSGIAPYSFDLNEARTEAANRSVAEAHILPKYLGPAEYATRDALRDRPGMTSGGVQLTSKYVVMYDPQQRPAPVRYTYVPQLALWDSMEAANPDALHAIDMAAVRGNAAEAKIIVEKAYGHDVAEALTKRRSDLPEIGKVIRSRANARRGDDLRSIFGGGQ